jgi:hypothetical protein
MMLSPEETSASARCGSDGTTLLREPVDASAVVSASELATRDCDVIGGRDFGSAYRPTTIPAASAAIAKIRGTFVKGFTTLIKRLAHICSNDRIMQINIRLALLVGIEII